MVPYSFIEVVCKLFERSLKVAGIISNHPENVLWTHQFYLFSSSTLFHCHQYQLCR